MRIKMFTVLFLLAYAVDAVAFDSAYRRGFGYSVNRAYAHVSSLHWTGFIGD